MEMAISAEAQCRYSLGVRTAQAPEKADLGKAIDKANAQERLLAGLQGLWSGELLEAAETS